MARCVATRFCLPPSQYGGENRGRAYYDTWVLSNQSIVFCYSEQFIANFIPCFLQFSFGLLCIALLVLKT